MGKSENLTLNNGNWFDDLTLTRINDKSDEKFDLYNKSISRFKSILPKNELKDLDTYIQKRENEILFEIPVFNNRSNYQKKYSKKIQSWQGIVLNYNDSSFLARLSDITNGGTDEIAEIDFVDVSPEDKSLIKEGSVFYWSVGYYMDSGQLIKQSDIRFQRLIPLDEQEFEEAMKTVESKFSRLKNRNFDNNTP